MKKTTLFAVLVLILAMALNAAAEELPYFSKGDATIVGGNSDFNKAAGDTIQLMGRTGSGAAYLGDFEAGMNGWTSEDLTEPTVTHWNVSNYNQSVGTNLAAWCGDISLASCNDSLDVAGGYGSDWHDLIMLRLPVADPGSQADVAITATLQYDSEPGYDYVYLSTQVHGQIDFTDLQTWDGIGTEAVNQATSYLPGELVNGTDIAVIFRFQSDGGWDDLDCSWPTAGACQIDDIVVTVTQGGQNDVVSTTDFQDGTLGAWTIAFPPGVGDYTQIWSGLEDVDPCNTNYSNQLAFIDDGIIVPGTGGSNCLNWCYGPQGYIVNTVGGPAGPSFEVENMANSPIMAWPNQAFDGILLEFDVFRHEDLSADAPGMFYMFGVRSGLSENDVESAAWQDRNGVYYGDGDYFRENFPVTDLMVPGRTHVQVQVGVWEAGWIWGWTGNDGYPAPYLDHISVQVYPFSGPGMTASEIDLANDNFPEIDEITFASLGQMHVRFDAARNISPANDLLNTPGDSIIVDIVPVRTGAVLAGAPELHYILDANPLFNAFRTAAISGMTTGYPAPNNMGIPSPTEWAFDLPDTGLMFPGDVLHYYFSAGDDVGGDIQYSTLPANITGFGDFSSPQAYNSSFVVHALPTISDDGFGGHETPATIFWNDFANRGAENEWYGALDNLGYVAGVDYDIYYTNRPDASQGNGIGGRTSGLAMEHYDNLLYSAGDLNITTIANGDFAVDAGDDIGALLTWMATGGKNLFLTGDSIASDLSINAGDSGVSFLETVMGLNLVAADMRSFIDNQTAPTVLAINPNPVFQTIDSWIAYGGCARINTFDAVEPTSAATRLAEFADPAGDPGAYTFAAATLNVYNTNNIISMPYDMRYLYTSSSDKVNAPLAARVTVLKNVLDFFGAADGTGAVTGVPSTQKFAVSNYPNPFNPTTRIDYSIKAPGHLTLKVFNVRGELVRTLVDSRVESSNFVMWDGTSDAGASVSSGVYFYEARMGNDVKVSKMALVK